MNRSAVDSLKRRSPIHFYPRRRRYNSRCVPVTNGTQHDEILAALVRNGIVVLPTYLDSDATATILEELVPALFRLRDGEKLEGARATSYPEYACFHLDEVERHASSSRIFSDDPLILSVASAYGGGRGVPFNTRAELRSGPLKNELVDDLHADTWMFRFKAMLYLTDVTGDTAPFRYLVGSHRDEYWKFGRFVYDFLGATFQGSPRVERFRLGQASRRYEDPRFERMLCTGAAGTVILFDARGVHSGTTLRHGQRMVLNCTFVLDEEAVTARG